MKFKTKSESYRPYRGSNRFRVVGCINRFCIDKTNSTEVSEAIQSMYRWYSHAAVWYAYLSDVLEMTFERSGWFLRGWTLQELLAPKSVIFFDRGWVKLGDKQMLSKAISAVSRIDADVLEGRSSIFSRSIAERMSLASQRITGRIENTAYSLLGIFDVNMPIMYGERDMAFYRPQKKIIKRSDDHSIFAWTGVEDGCPGLLAPSPGGFQRQREGEG